MRGNGNHQIELIYGKTRISLGPMTRKLSVTDKTEAGPVFWRFWGEEGQHGRSGPRRRRATFAGSDLTFSAIANDRTRAGFRRMATSSLSTRTLREKFFRSGVFDVPLRHMELQKLIWEPHGQAAHLSAGYR
jgi:hypothetical protein